ncbi:hypothetical protein PTTG_01798 [Puccinia triticina 1-1 BBBD Race 1]|uniref:Cir_N domain-containing protein n=2 Tax=Puccinia triticina TaxID=208348 RepID=A0A0C4EM09_PUCT1|nr:uncharacterized protein PtA15_11A621 [Puccinia triticina]OAV98571.1 hypothetical protein PTTG_01798 [Puccinia triticina 1-1 BBBD Race 1]WAQ89929.1 hypothetical protein PtA15_11A621 [Puccinia triticina]
MGGGDLNMKKSWHPLLMKNQERVWKEERKAVEERKKTAQLQKELAEERQLQELQRIQAEQGGGRREERVDWLYATPAIGNGVNAEEQEAYLLGKKTVDKLFKEKDEAAAKLQAKAASQSDADKAGGGFISLQNANTARDTASKIREDPLLAIKQQEQQALENLRKNPARLKALQSSLTTKEQDVIKMIAVGLRRREMNLNGQEVEIITRGNQTSLSVPMAIPDLTEERLQIADALLIVALIVVAALFPPKAAIDLEVPIELPVLLDERLITEMAVIEPLDLLMIGIATLVTPSDLVLVLHCVPIETDLVLPYAPIGTVLALHSAPIGIIHQNTQLIAALLGPSDLRPSTSTADGAERVKSTQKLSDAKAAKLAEMQAAAKSLHESRSQRLEKLEAEDLERTKIEEAERERNRIKSGGVGDGNKAKFVMEQEKKVFFGQMGLAERVKRSGGVGLLKDKE